jgi:hypothetical protein
VKAAIARSLARGPRLDPIAEAAIARSLARGPRLDPIAEAAIARSLARGPRPGNRSLRCPTSCIPAVVGPVGEARWRRTFMDRTSAQPEHVLHVVQTVVLSHHNPRTINLPSAVLHG